MEDFSIYIIILLEFMFVDFTDNEINGKAERNVQNVWCYMATLDHIELINVPILRISAYALPPKTELKIKQTQKRIFPNN